MTTLTFPAVEAVLLFEQPKVVREGQPPTDVVDPGANGGRRMSRMSRWGVRRWHILDVLRANGNMWIGPQRLATSVREQARYADVLAQMAREDILESRQGIPARVFRLR